jgi:siderophore synthetase component
VIATPIVSIERTCDDNQTDADYLCIRVLDTLLREDVRECVSRAALVRGDRLPFSAPARFDAAPYWLHSCNIGPAPLWIPVAPTRYMQDWRVTAPFVVSERADGFIALHDIDSILTAFASGLSDEMARAFTAYADECKIASHHRRAALAERARWYAAPDSAADSHASTWDRRMVHYERLASFVDHPFYPSARAKVGFDTSDLAHYAPEFAPVFELNWLAVPSERCQTSGHSRPAHWPRFADVGLASSLSTSHALVPVHPFVWRRHLSAFLESAGLSNEVVRAPAAHLQVTPTLSVRSLILVDEPEWHIKVPLTIRTLGAKNVRTIKSSTIGDGQRMQTLLQVITAQEPALRGRILFTDEGNGAHVDKHPLLGFILRHYPAEALAEATLVPVAGLLAETAAGKSVAEELAERFGYSDLDAWFDDYLELTLRLHLTLWVRYGIALESNQQNTMLVHGDNGLRLLLKDNDAARIDRRRLARRWPGLDAHLHGLEDLRIEVMEPHALAQMFTTITLQLNIAALIEGLAQRVAMDRAAVYSRVRSRIEAALADLAAEGDDIAVARHVLLEDEHLYLKYLLTAASLFDKAQTGAMDVNKFYGKRAPNFLKENA